MNMLSVLRSVFSLDALIYLAILFLLFTSMARCFVPLAAVTRRLRRAARTVIQENKQKKPERYAR